MPTVVGRLKYDWYQTDQLVVVSVLIKNLNENDVKVQFSTDTVELDCRLPDGALQKLHLNLFKPIDPDASNVKVSASKLEMRLKKVEAVRWTTLENDNPRADLVPESTEAALVDDDDTAEVIDGQVVEATAAAQPVTNGESSGKKNPKNWDKIVKEFEEEEKQVLLTYV